MDNGWFVASKRLPTQEESAAFGTVEVITQCNPSTGGGPWQSMRLARVVFIGGNETRPLWISAENKTGEPIENAAWFVTHWRPFPKFPKTI